MKYRYGIVLKHCNDYVRRADLSWLTFLTDEIQNKLRVEFDKKGRLFISDDVNTMRVDSFMELMRENNVDASIVSVSSWKNFPDIPEIHE